jgi:cell division protein FtsZ
VNVRTMMVVNNNDEENDSTPLASASSPLDGNANDENDDDLVTSRNPHQLKNKRGAFLGFRNAKDVPGWTEMRANSYAGSVKAAAALANGQLSSTELQSQVQPLMPDGGLSPCVIRVLGVGGGGCNAVRIFVMLPWVSIYTSVDREEDTVQEPVK